MNRSERELRRELYNENRNRVMGVNLTQEQYDALMLRIQTLENDVATGALAELYLQNFHHLLHPQNNLKCSYRTLTRQT